MGADDGDLCGGVCVRELGWCFADVRISGTWGGGGVDVGVDVTRVPRSGVDVLFLKFISVESGCACKGEYECNAKWRYAMLCDE